MAEREPDVIETNHITGEQRAIYHFGSKTSPLDVGTSEEIIDAGDMIYIPPGSNGVLTLYNKDTGETVDIQPYECMLDEPGAFSTNPDDWVPVGDVITVPVQSGGLMGRKRATFERDHRYMIFTKVAGSSLTGKLTGMMRGDRHDCLLQPEDRGLRRR